MTRRQKLLDNLQGYRVALLLVQGKVFPRNGGVPQEGNLALHLQRLQQSIEEQVPKDINGEYEC